MSSASRAGMLVVITGLTACGAVDHPPPLRDIVPSNPDSGRIVRPPRPGTTRTDAGSDAGSDPGSDAGPPCVPRFIGPARLVPFEGTVVELDDGTIPVEVVRPAPPRYLNTTPLDRGTVSVELEKPGCGLATAESGPDGSFAVDGVGAGEVFIRLRPVDRPDLVTTIFAIDGRTTARLAYPILTRNALSELFAIGRTSQTPNPDRGHIVVNFLDGSPGGTTFWGATIDQGPPGTITYDGQNASGALGLGMILNAVAAEYPGEPATVVTGYAGTVPPPPRVVIAQDAVMFLLVGFGF